MPSQLAMVLSDPVLSSPPEQEHTGLFDQNEQVHVQFPVAVHDPPGQVAEQRFSLNAYARWTTFGEKNSVAPAASVRRASLRVVALRRAVSFMRPPMD
jgi:hypothetical protein